MVKHPIAVTAWEVEAARRREVVEGDFGVDRTFRGDRSVPSNTSARIAPRLPQWMAALAGAVTGSCSDEVDQASPCQPTARAVEPGA